MTNRFQCHVSDRISALAHHQSLRQQGMQTLDAHRHAASAGAFDMLLTVSHGNGDFMPKGQIQFVRTLVGGFQIDQRKQLPEFLADGADAAETIIFNGLAKAQEQFNGR